MKDDGESCLVGTKLIALSAMTEAQFRKHGSTDFDMFSKSLTLSIYSGEARPYSGPQRSPDTNYMIIVPVFLNVHASAVLDARLLQPGPALAYPVDLQEPHARPDTTANHRVRAASPADA